MSILLNFYESFPLSEENMKQNQLWKSVIVISFLVFLTPVFLFAQDGRTETAKRIELAKYLPQKTFLFTVIPDAPDVKQKLINHRLVKSVENEEIRAFLKPMFENKNMKEVREKVRNTTGHTIDQLTDMLTGPVGVALVEGKKGLYAKNPDHDPAANVQGLLLVRVGENENTITKQILPSLVEKWKKKVRKKGNQELFEKTLKIDGGTIHTYMKRTENETEPVGSWITVNGYLLAASPNSTTLLKKTVQRIRGANRGSSLHEMENYQSVMRTAGDAEMVLYTNLKHVFDASYEQAQKEYRNNDGRQGPSPDDVFSTLGFNTMRHLVATLELNSSYTELDAELAYSERKGISKILAFRPISPASDELISLPPSILAGAAWGFSFRTLWERGREAYQKLSPRIDKMMDMQLNRVKKNYGVDIKKDIVNALGDRVLIATFPPAQDDEQNEEGETSTMDIQYRRMWALELNDTDRLKEALKSFKDNVEKGKKVFSSRNYLGTKIYSINESALSPLFSNLTPSYAFLNGYLVISMHEKVVEDMIAHVNRDPAEGFFEQKSVQRAFEHLPGDASGLTYTNLKTMLNFVLDQLKGMNPLQEGNPLGNYVNLKAGLSSEVIGQIVQFTAGGFYVEEQEARLLFRLQHSN